MRSAATVGHRPLEEGDAWPAHAYHFGLTPDHKYHVRRDPSTGDWNVAVKHRDTGDYYLAEEWVFSESPCEDLVEAVNAVARKYNGQPGGSFYYNEYNQVLKPIGTESGSELRYVGEFDECYFFFDLGDRGWDTRPSDLESCPNGLEPGDEWWGPKCGVPYTIDSSGQIYRPSVQWFENEMVKVEDRLYLDRYASDYEELSDAIMDAKGWSGGNFYVTEAGLIWAPYKKRSGWGYAYAGFLWHLVQKSEWFPGCGTR